MKAHLYEGVQGACREDVTESPHHEESKKARCEESSWAVIRRRIIINAPQRGQCQIEAVAGEVSAGSETADVALAHRIPHLPGSNILTKASRSTIFSESKKSADCW